VFAASLLSLHFRVEERQQIVVLSVFDLQPVISSLEMPTRVLTRAVRELRLGAILLLAVPWNRGDVVGTSWKREVDMFWVFPQLFVAEILIYLNLWFLLLVCLCFVHDH
jgi:hypothetical protein